MKTDASIKSRSSHVRSFQSSSGSDWHHCAPVPCKGSDTRKTKSDVEPRYWEKAEHKYERRIGENWVTLKRYRKLYVESSSSESAKGSQDPDSESDGSLLTEKKSCDSFDAQYEVQNADRNRERKELHKIKKHVHSMVKHLVNRALKKAIKNEELGRREETHPF